MKCMRVAAVAAAAFVMSGCGIIYEYDDCHDAFRVESDWRYAPSAQPDGMAYMFFSTNGADFWRYDLPGRNGGELPLPTGQYRALCFNDDTSSVLMSDPEEGFGAMKVWTRDTQLLDEPDDEDGSIDAVDGQRVVQCPDQMWSEAAEAMSLTGSEVSWTASGRVHSSDARIMTFYPRPVMPTYTCEITGITNLSGVRRMVGALSGMSSGIYLSDMSHEPECVALPLAVRRLTDSSVGGSCLTFGQPGGGNDVDCHLWLYVWLTDGTKLRYSFDVSEQVEAAPDPMDVYIKVGGIDLPESHPAGQGAFDVSVDGWVETVINIRH